MGSELCNINKEDVMYKTYNDTWKFESICRTA